MSLTLPELLDALEAVHGPPARPLPRTALEWILWENAAYLVRDEQRRKAYRALEEATGLTAKGILALPREELRTVAALGGMHPDSRVAKLVAIATTVQESFDGDLEAALELPIARARQALRKFPGIGAPGADKILLFTGTHAIAALESNGLRALVRLGLAQEGKDYARTYRAGVAAFAPHLDRGCGWLVRAHLLLKQHGQELCKNTAPRCDECALSEACPSAS